MTDRDSTSLVGSWCSGDTRSGHEPFKAAIDAPTDPATSRRPEIANRRGPFSTPKTCRRKCTKRNSRPAALFRHAKPAAAVARSCRRRRIRRSRRVRRRRRPPNHHRAAHWRSRVSACVMRTGKSRVFAPAKRTPPLDRNDLQPMPLSQLRYMGLLRKDSLLTVVVRVTPGLELHGTDLPGCWAATRTNVRADDDNICMAEGVAWWRPHHEVAQ